MSCVLTAFLFIAPTVSYMLRMRFSSFTVIVCLKSMSYQCLALVILLTMLTEIKIIKSYPFYIWMIFLWRYCKKQLQYPIRIPGNLMIRSKVQIKERFDYPTTASAVLP